MAGPSAADIRAALSLPSTSTGLSHAAPLARKPSLRKPEGMPRELYQLIGPSAPTMVAQFAKPQLKQKPNLGSSGQGPPGVGKVRWEWRSFANSGRTDGLKLSHWVKAGTDADAEYPFAKYNIQSKPYVYSQDEYTRFLDDKEWTKEETDYLFGLMNEFDGRFYIVGDRYDFPGGPPRSLEDLKDRYCSVCRKLIRNRPWAGNDASKTQLLSSFQFDKEREVTRKKYVASLESRTPEQIAEEEALYIELKRLEQTERRFKKDRDELLRTLLGIESGLPDINTSDEDALHATGGIGLSISLGGLGMDSNNKKRKKGGDIDTPVSATSASTNVIQLGPPGQKKQQSAKSAAYDALHCIVRTDVPASASSNKAAHTPVYLRTYKIPGPKAALAPKIASLMAELQINHTRLVMPTRENYTRLEGLLDAAAALIETKKSVDRVDMELMVAKARLAGGSGEGASGSGEGSVGGGGENGMEVDEDAEGDQEEGVDGSGRGQSVVSTRSGRGRKPARRSMSISSVDTAATGNKRKKR